LHGLVTGFSWGMPDECGYAGCHGKIVSSAPRVKWVCADHLSRPKLPARGGTITLADYIQRQVAIRDDQVKEQHPLYRWVWFE
jgi:hypothetical protein